MEKLKLTQIVPDKNQPRKYFQVEKMASLKDSIRRNGIISPLIVQKEGDKYLLIDGERRYRSATELGLKEVPVQIVIPKNDFARLVEQFHIQEQHEEWTSVEKAQAILNIVEVSKKSLQEVCEMLSVDSKSLRMYIAFARLQHKERFFELQISISNAEKIQELKNFVRLIKEKTLNQAFTKNDESKLEKAIIEKIKDKEITGRRDYTRIKDSFRSQPKLIEKFLSGDFDIDAQFVKSNARGAYYARNMIQNLTYCIANAQGFLKEKSVTLTAGDVTLIKRGSRVLEDVLKLVE